MYIYIISERGGLSVIDLKLHPPKQIYTINVNYKNFNIKISDMPIRKVYLRR